MKLFHLLRLLTWSFYRNDLLKTALTILGMALGIAVFIAIRLANENSRLAFSSSTKLLSGSSGLYLVSEAGAVPESMIAKILETGMVEEVSALSIQYLPARRSGLSLGLIQLIGLDPLRPLSTTAKTPDSTRLNRDQVIALLQKPRSVFVSNKLAEAPESANLELLVNGSWTPVEVLAKLPADGLAAAFGGFVAVMDIAHFQDLTGSWGKIDSLELIPAKGHSADAVKAAVSPLLPSTLYFQPAGEQATHAARMTEAFSLNLNFLASISLFVGVLLIYNTASFAILKRRRDFGILLSLGMHDKQIRRFVCFESLLLGLVASLLGLLLGYLMSLAAVQVISGTISALYLPVRVGEVHVPIRFALEALLLGPALSLIATLIPLRELGSLPVRETFHYQSHEEAFRKALGTFVRWGALCLLGAGVFANGDLLRYSVYFGFVSPTLLVIGAALLSPAGLFLLLKTCHGLVGKLLGIEVLLAADHIQSTLRRSSVAVAAMVMSIGMFLGVSMMIASFRQTVGDWISHITKADLYISLAQMERSSLRGYLPPEIVEGLRSLPEVADYDTVAGKKFVFFEREMRVHGVRFEVVDRYDRLLFLKPVTKTELNKALSNPQTVLISESFANRSGKRIGDSLRIPGSNQDFQGIIVNIFYDYSSDQGVVFIADQAFEALDGETRKQGVSLYLKDSSQAPELQAKIAAMFPNVALDIRNNHQLRLEVLRVFDETFRITYALQAIALLVAGFTILNTVLMLLLERRREFAVMRAIGASSWSLTKMITIEAMLLGIAAVIGGLMVGGCLSLLLVYVINKFFFGWSMQFYFAPGFFLTAALGTLLLAVAAGLFPGRGVAGRIDGALLRYE